MTAGRNLPWTRKRWLFLGSVLGSMAGTGQILGRSCGHPQTLSLTPPSSGSSKAPNLMFINTLKNTSSPTQAHPFGTPWARLGFQWWDPGMVDTEVRGRAPRGHTPKTRQWASRGH